jgi:uncharacterized protein YndB with AHSA1/START domain
MGDTATDLEVRITRDFDAPREEVFRAWTDPDEVAAWFGPAQFETPRDRVRIDARAGGRYELTMVRRDGGGEFALGYDIVEFVEPELIVLRSDPMPGMDEPPVVRVELTEHEGGTRMTLSDGPHPGPGRDAAAGGWSAAMDKLAARLAGGGS